MPDALRIPLRAAVAVSAAATPHPLPVPGREQGVVVEDDIVDVVRAFAGLDDMHVDVLRIVARGVGARTDRIEAVVAFRVGTRPTT